MPLPIPEPDEDREEFVARCMRDETMINEFANVNQRLAVCNTQYEEEEN
jgi:hypothetical protein